MLQIYAVVREFEVCQGVINGGSQSTRNLLTGLHALGANLTLLSFSQLSLSQESFSHHSLSHQRKPEVEFGTCEFGPIVWIRGMAPVRSWRDTTAIAQLQAVLEQLPQVPAVFHLLEAYEYLGSWLAALARRPVGLVVTALDYFWICHRSHLLTARGDRCQGATDAAHCLQCAYQHRNPLKAATLLGSSYLPGTAAATKRRWLSEKMAGLHEDSRKIDALIAPSRILHDVFIDHGFDCERVFHVPYGTPPSAKLTHRERPPLDQGIIIGFIGKLTFDKGLDILLEALCQVREQHPTLRLIVYAAPHPSGFGRSLWRRLHAEPYCRWVSVRQFNGRDPAAIDAAHRALHIQVAPSRWTDNLPNALLEGIERQTPAIAPAYGSFLEMVVPGQNGWLYDGTAEGLQQVLRQILENPQSWLDLPFAIPKTRPITAEAADILEIYGKIASRKFSVATQPRP